MSNEKTSDRLLTLDYLRGYFILVIIIDHLARWPNLLGAFTGQALLWVTAAEGFIIISGLLVGYVRGHKNRQDSMKKITSKLLRRAGLLCLWSIIGTIAYSAIIWHLHLKGGSPGMPFDRVDDWGNLIGQTLTLQYTFVWVYFLTLYALFLAASPIAVWLFRKNKAWLVVLLSLVILAFGWQRHNEFMQWQALFFIPSAVGYYLEPIRDWWKNLTGQKRQLLTSSIWGVTALTIVLSVIFTFYPNSVQSPADQINSSFAKDTISIYRILLAFVWFTGFLLLFARLNRWIKRWLGWLLIPLGTRSLTAYILHGLALCTVSYFVLSSENILFNTLLGAITILIVWALLKIPFVQKVIPR